MERSAGVEREGLRLGERSPRCGAGKALRDCGGLAERYEGSRDRGSSCSGRLKPFCEGSGGRCRTEGAGKLFCRSRIGTLRLGAEVEVGRGEVGDRRGACGRDGAPKRGERFGERE